MNRVFRISEITKPRGPISRSKIYSDAAAGLIEFRKIGGTTVVTEAAWVDYLAGKPLIHSAARRAA